MKGNGTSLPPRLQRLVGWKFRSGTRLLRRKQWASAFFEPFSVGAFGLLGEPPHSHRLAKSSNASDPMFAYEDREVPLEGSDRGERE